MMRKLPESLAVRFDILTHRLEIGYLSMLSIASALLTRILCILQYITGAAAKWILQQPHANLF